MTVHSASSCTSVNDVNRNMSGLHSGHVKSPALLTALGMIFGFSLFALVYIFAMRRRRSSQHPQQTQDDLGIRLTIGHERKSGLDAEPGGSATSLVDREKQLNNLRAQLDSVSAQHDDLSIRLAERDKEVGDLRAQLQAVIGERDDLTLKLHDALTQTATPATRSDNTEVDDLLAITGVGPVYAARLRAAGYSRFVDVAQTTAEALADVIKAPAWRTPNYEEWIAHARQLAGIK